MTNSWLVLFAIHQVVRQPPIVLEIILLALQTPKHLDLNTVVQLLWPPEGLVEVLLLNGGQQQIQIYSQKFGYGNWQNNMTQIDEYALGQRLGSIDTKLDLIMNELLTNLKKKDADLEKRVRHLEYLAWGLTAVVSVVYPFVMFYITSFAEITI